jgi:hypothetical protein
MTPADPFHRPPMRYRLIKFETDDTAYPTVLECATFVDICAALTHWYPNLAMNDVRILMTSVSMTFVLVGPLDIILATMTELFT